MLNNPNFKSPDLVLSLSVCSSPWRFVQCILEVMRQWCYRPSHTAWALDWKLNSKWMWWEMEQGRHVCGDGGITKLPILKNQPVSWFLLDDVQVLPESVCLKQTLICTPSSPQPLFSVSSCLHTTLLDSSLCLIFELIPFSHLCHANSNSHTLGSSLLTGTGLVWSLINPSNCRVHSSIPWLDAAIAFGSLPPAKDWYKQQEKLSSTLAHPLCIPLLMNVCSSCRSKGLTFTFSLAYFQSSLFLLSLTWSLTLQRAARITWNHITAFRYFLENATC